MAARRRTSGKRPSAPDRLADYRAKRDFRVTPEPAASPASPPGDLFVVQMHDATRLHYDLRLELGGVLRSWAVTRGPSLDPKVKRLAVRTEDHPVTYGGFEGLIPEGEYGGGAVIVWDTGRWVPMSENPEADIASGHIKFRLDGHKLKGGYALVKLKGGRASEKDWLLVKERDIYAKPEADGVVTEDATESVVSGRTVAEIEAALAPAPRAKVAKPRAAKLPGAVAGDCPERLEPALASLVDEPPEGSDWLHEIKFDGYRTIAHLRDGRATMRTRNGHDWTERYGAIAAELGQLPCQSAVIDGEVCVQLPSGATSFAALQDALAEGADHRMVFFAFDLAYLDGYDLRRVPLERRKRALLGLLQDRLGATSALQFGDHAEGSGHEFFAHAANLGLEGIVSKGRHSPYVSGRSRDWLKTKGAHAGEFVVVGFDESKAAGGLGALVLAETANHKLRYAGKVGTGFSAAEAQRLLRSLHKLRREAPIATLIAREETETADTVWVQPKLVVEVEYANRTPKGHLRAPRFKGVRADKPADSAPVNKPKLVTDSVLASLWITNPDRVMFGANGPTKLDLTLYYARVGDWMLPEIVNRPLTLIRCPTGKVEDVFYQRHASEGMPKEVKTIDMYEPGEKEREDYLYIEDAKGLLALSQFGVIEFHPWGCRIDKIDRPDRVVIDLDPDESLDWRAVVDAAFEVRDELAELGVESFVRTTGGKGVHVVFALERRPEWDDMKGFAHDFVRRLEKRHPKRYTANPQTAARRGRVFADYLRNGRGATAVASYSLRARAGAPVATPVTWEELRTIEDPRDFDWRTVPQRLAELRADPWAGLGESGLRLTAELRRKTGR